jgi:hypothetical protein
MRCACVCGLIRQGGRGKSLAPLHVDRCLPCKIYSVKTEAFFTPEKAAKAKAYWGALGKGWPKAFHEVFGKGS